MERREGVSGWALGGRRGLLSVASRALGVVRVERRGVRGARGGEDMLAVNHWFLEL